MILVKIHNLALGVLALAFAVGTAQADLPADPREYAEWQDRMLQAVAKNQTQGDHAALEKLARYVFQLSLPTNLEQGDRPIFQAARRAILSLPNHSDYFSRAIDSAIEAEFAEARDAATAIRVSPTRGEIYLTLVELQSPGVVGLLGRLLYDERDPWKDEPKSDFSRPYPNSFHAVDTLNRIGLDGVQIIELKSDRDYEAALNQWKLWYEQVKAGTRTFRFRGDPKEYTLAGPVAQDAESAAIHSESLPPVQPAAEPGNGKRPIPVVPLVIAGVLLALALGFAIKRRGERAIRA